MQKQHQLLQPQYNMCRTIHTNESHKQDDTEEVSFLYFLLKVPEDTWFLFNLREKMSLPENVLP